MSKGTTVRKRERKFYTGLLIFFLIMLLLICLGLVVFWMYLKDYQECLPTNIAQKAEEAYANGDTSSIIGWSRNLPDILKNEDMLSSYLNGTYDKSDVYYYEDSDSESTVKTYAIMGGSRKLAEITVEPYGSKSRFGHFKYQITGLEQEAMRTYTITAPGSAEVLLNGSPISESYITEKTPVTDEFSSVSMDNIEICTYVIKDLICVNTLSAQGCSTVKTDNDDYTISYIVSDEQKAAIKDFAEGFVKSYTLFTTKKDSSGYMGQVLACILPGTELYDAISSYTNDWGKNFDSDEYRKLDITDIKRYDKNAYSCSAAAEYVIKQGAAEKSYDFNFILYMTDADGTWKIIKMK